MTLEIDHLVVWSCCEFWCRRERRGRALTFSTTGSDMASLEPWCKLRGVIFLSLTTLSLMPWTERERKRRERSRYSDEMSSLPFCCSVDMGCCTSSVG